MFPLVSYEHILWDENNQKWHYIFLSIICKGHCLQLLAHM